MAHLGKHSHDSSHSKTSGASTSHASEATQLDFELDFFEAILRGHPTYVDVLRVMGHLLTLKGRFQDGLQIDKRLVQLRPSDSLAHYNLACSYALLNRPELSIKTLRKALELGYEDLRFLKQDKDLDSIRQDPRFRKLIREFEGR